MFLEDHSKANVSDNCTGTAFQIYPFKGGAQKFEYLWREQFHIEFRLYIRESPKSRREELSFGVGEKLDKRAKRCYKGAKVHDL